MHRSTLEVATLSRFPHDSAEATKRHGVINMGDYILWIVGAAAVLMFIAGNASRWDSFKRLLQRTPTYDRQPALFTNAEINFYRTLAQAVETNYLIMGKVRVADLLKVKGALANPREKRTAFNKITGKHIDFVLVDPKSMAVVCCIELDDSSHQKKARKDRDVFLNDAFREASLPLLRVPCARTYRVDPIRALIRKAAKSSIKDLAALQGMADSLADQEQLSEPAQTMAKPRQELTVPPEAKPVTSGTETNTDNDLEKFRQYLETHKQT